MSSTNAFTRRGFLAASAGAAGAIGLSPLLAACGNNGGKGGASTKAAIQAVLPTYKPLSGGVTPDIPSVPGTNGAMTDPGFLKYPSTLPKTVTGQVGSGGRYAGVAPSWNPVPPAGNSYYEAVNKALGATFVSQPANGNTYNTVIPPLIAADKLPDWLSIPGWLNPTFDTGGLVGTKLADLTTYLGGDAVLEYPNLAAIPSGGWKCGIWNNRLYGIPSQTDSLSFAGAIYYRKDLLDAKGITPNVKTAQDFEALGREINNPGGGVWAFDDMLVYLYQVFKVPLGGWYLENGKIKNVGEHPAMLECLAWANKIAKAGLVHPDAIAGVNTSNPSRFMAGKVYIEAGGMAGLSGPDAKNGTAGKAGYQRALFPLFSSDGSTPSIGLGGSSGWMSYLNKNLNPEQIKECLRIANFFAAPFGSFEYNLLNYGVEGVHYTMGPEGPVFTKEGSNTAADGIFGFFSTAQTAVYNAGYPDVTKAMEAWCADAAKHAYKPMFWNLNISVPSQFSKTAAQTELWDATQAVAHGKQPVSYYQDAYSRWKSGGGDALGTWYQQNLIDKGLS
ncbi:ABC-type sugar transport system periplasmic component [Catenulispora acidiphila DSM 44928]|uniref:ABC-type sugar transport system periplasmic component n=1 Tax=Catenulispora acidiphila (strain DSM 44928 / JCM 14897 / NBRC 102108 / NRRL B-24433 / ID139908) TaxID=479433 RepID=C7Q362_CATAD|nr:extracellular solute-binding protein [Catenulispora acidiphila]ACU73798.1 ABC-type sugar transport system periplasmic component [Catenulispora acidiphila DSM 44928]